MDKLELVYGEEVIPVSVTRTKRKSLSLSIGTDGVVTAKAPTALTDAELLKWMKTKMAWIVRKRSEMLRASSLLSADRQYVTGERIWYLGEAYTLEIRKSEARAGRVTLTDEQLVIFLSASELALRENGAEGVSQYREIVKAYISRFYEKEAHVLIPKRVRYYAAMMGETFGRISIKNQKSRWGSCSSARNLNFNWRLMMAPLPVLDYVVVHEICHLKQMNHSRLFWAEVEKVLPDYEARKKWLDENGKRLRLE